MNVLLKGREVAFYLEDPGAKIVFAWGDFAEAAEAGAEQAGTEVILVKPGEFEKLLADQEPDRDVVDRTADDTAVILYTSGTTGKPKGAELTHANLHRNSAGVSEKLGEMGKDDVLLGALPLFHSFGQTCTMNSAVSVGATVTMLPRFDPDKALEIIERDKVTIFQGVPTMYNAMLHSESCDSADCSSLRLCMSGGAAMPAELMRAFEEKFGCIILEGYGLSETSPVASFNHPDKERKPGSIGTPIEGVEMQVWDDDGNEVAQGEVGEIVIRGHNIMKGYWNRDEANKEAITDDGWFRTGDMAKMDEDGYFFIVDRKKDLIIRGGYNVYPREIEEVLYEHPAIQEAAVVGVPARRARRGGRRGGGAEGGRVARRRRAEELRQGAGGRLQVPAQGVVRGRAAQGPHRQDPQARDRGAGEGRSLDELLVPTAGEAHRIETHPEERRVQVRINGETVADSTRALALTEGKLPTRWYLPREDISAELEPSQHWTTCPFKGEAAHFSVGGEDAVAWSYEDPIEQVSEIRDLVAFYNERVDLQLD